MSSTERERENFKNDVTLKLGKEGSYRQLLLAPRADEGIKAGWAKLCLVTPSSSGCHGTGKFHATPSQALSPTPSPPWSVQPTGSQARREISVLCCCFLCGGGSSISSFATIKYKAIGGWTLVSACAHRFVAPMLHFRWLQKLLLSIVFVVLGCASGRKVTDIRGKSVSPKPGTKPPAKPVSSLHRLQF